MGRLLDKIGVKKTLVISVCFMLFHLVEDFMWVTLGRYTDLRCLLLLPLLSLWDCLAACFFVYLELNDS